MATIETKNYAYKDDREWEYIYFVVLFITSGALSVLATNTNRVEAFPLNIFFFFFFFSFFFYIYIYILYMYFSALLQPFWNM